MRSLTLPGYWKFTLGVLATLRTRSRTFIFLIVLYAAIALLSGIVTSQASYDDLVETMKTMSSELAAGDIGKIGEAGLLSIATLTNVTTELSSEQQIVGSAAMLFVWLTTVWLLREYKAGRKPKLRDGLYNSGAPVLATASIVFIGILQCLPIGVLAIIYAALSSIGLVQSGFGAMLFAMIALVVFTMVFYWLTSTFLALVIVTLPGMYPMQAMKAAGDLVIGRRLRVMYRMIWCIGLIIIGWLLTIIPVILLEQWIRSFWSSIESIPVVPVTLALITSCATAWGSAYIYLLYRRIVDDDTKPA